MSCQLFRVGKVWHYRFQIDGVRVQRSTGETLRHRAESIAERAHRYAALWSRREQSIPTLRELVAQWLTVHAPTTSKAHSKIVETFGRLHLYQLADVMIDELTTAMVEEARNEYLKNHAPASANQWLKVLRLLCSWAVRREVIPAVRFRVRTLAVQKRPRAILSTSLASQWLEAVDTHEGDKMAVRIAVRLMLGLGLREIETITARFEWLDWERRAYIPGKTKGKEAEPIPVPLWLIDYLQPMRQPSGLIVARPNGKPCPSGFTRTAMLAANTAVGTGHVTAHRLRGTFATLMSEMGAPIQSIQRAMRHKSPLTTMAYLEVNMDFVAKAQQSIAHKMGFSTQSDVSGNQAANETALGGEQQGASLYHESSRF
ncbi:integrase/recombinase XerC [Caballeronia udeis]|uniref:Integrase/recombinase XerC n=1 Tax=Caballeronia udeis TaxID=1232866 RepID=A0ABW8MUT0_9BURK